MRRLKNLVKQVLTEEENRRYEKQLAKRCVSYDSWVKQQECRKEAGQQGAAVLPAGDADAEPVAEIIRMPWGKLAEHAEALIEQYFVEHPEVQIVYGDEDVWQNAWQGGKRSNPWYKPDWSPDLFDSWFYFGSVVAIRRAFVDRHFEMPEDVLFPYIDMVRNDEEDATDYVASIRDCLEKCGAWQRDCKAIGHIPEILFHCDSVENQMRYMQWKTKAAGQERLKAWKDVQLSIIIPSKDNPEILEKCIAAIINTEEKLNYELIIVDNGSSEINRRTVELLLNTCEGMGSKSNGLRAGLCTTKYIYQPMEFNFSKMCNLGAQNASGELLLFLNDDVELCVENCLSEMAELAVAEHTGAVGLKLYYPASKRIQHAGITNLPMGPVHKLQFLEDDEDYYFGVNSGLRNVLAVTAACLMVEKKKFLKVQGFAEELQVAFNDVDFCFKLYEQGYSNVCNNNCYAYHHESLSRGDDESTEKWLRLLRERDALYDRHPKLEGKDPYYGAGLGREGLDTRVRCEYETAGNRIQQMWLQKNGMDATIGESKACGSIKAISVTELAKYRQDNCLMLRVENCRQGILQGYGVVLGDNNACYEKEIVLEAMSTAFGDDNTELQRYRIPIEGQYRPDLVENMPDQNNVGLSGFWIEFKELPKGSYRIGMTVSNRVTGLKLINWSSRILTVE